MQQVFLSYARSDHLFAELAKTKLENHGISVWYDSGQLRAGNDWRKGIDKGISECSLVLLVLSKDSSVSSFVTYEWAFAMGKSKPIVPVLLDECELHPKIEPIQYLDFSKPGFLPWEDLFERITENEVEQDNEDSDHVAKSKDKSSNTREKEGADSIVTSILNYLNRRGYQMVSFDRIRRRIDEHLTDEQLNKVIEDNPSIFRPAMLKGQKRGMAKL